MTLQLPEGRFEGFIFDCNGTIADSMEIHYRAWVAALEEQGGTLDRTFYYSMGGVPAEELIANLNAMQSIAMPIEATADRKQEITLEYMTDVTAIPEVLAIIDAHHGVTPMAVASGGRRDVVLQTLEKLGLHHHFSVVVTQEDTARGKPHPDPFLKAAELLGVDPSKCLVFEDSPIGKKAADAAGMACVLVPEQ